ncbi:MAG: cobyrinate a,c-diamide synthase [Desulfurivibrionaceae bacterium]
MTKGVVIAGLGGGAGKSVVAVGLAAALRERGDSVVPFKKGPDYIDAGWLGEAAGAPCFHLDPYLMEDETIVQAFINHCQGRDYAVIEGNRGLFDGVDSAGTYSTAELATLLGLPVLLVVDCTKTTRTVAAMVYGCCHFSPGFDIKGVILNRIGSNRHEKVIREAVEEYTSVPVLGALERMPRDVFPMRHLGVTPFQEYAGVEETVAELAEKVESSCDLERIKESMADSSAEKKGFRRLYSRTNISKDVRIGVIRDEAFQFYYPDNILALEERGAEIVTLNALTDRELPVLDGLYIGGGFPETSARDLSVNLSFRESLKQWARKGLPVYAECGGLIYLGESIILEEGEFPLTGVFPVKFSLEAKPQAHGYTVLRALNGNPFYEEGTVIRGHEFRYSRIAAWSGKTQTMSFSVERGVGLAEKRDGLSYRNVLALYTHIHALATPEWAEGLVEKARQFKNSNG